MSVAQLLWCHHPALFQPSPSVVDKWTLAAFMRNDGSLQRIMEAHYDEFITEQDIVAIAGAGLNWVRLPIPFWSIRLHSLLSSGDKSTWLVDLALCCFAKRPALPSWTDIGADAAGNPVSELFLQGMWWKYIVRLLGWACKYSIRVNLDLRTAPGSQNGVFFLVSILPYLLDMCAWVEDLRPQCGLTSGVDDARVGRQGVAGDEHWG
ncbi:glycoside hydrolase superfamily [Mycena olivaceomarginata]|nr:glycoside hydrolase superfamily [Mycena olivaceomarginata]